MNFLRIFINRKHFINTCDYFGNLPIGLKKLQICSIIPFKLDNLAFNLEFLFFTKSKN